MGIVDNNRGIFIADPGKDRLAKHFKLYLGRFVFLNIIDLFLSDKEFCEEMKNIPLPLKAEKVEEKKDFSASEVFKDMIFILGMDTKFPYKNEYVKILKHVFRENIIEALVDLGRTYLTDENNMEAAIVFRTGLLCEPDNKHFLYGYARVCRDIYLAEEDDESLIGDFKAEAFQSFEKLTLLYPDFDEPFYFLAYAYLNMGLYLKAKLTFQKFMEIATNEEGKKEVRERLEQIEAPVMIEMACNDVLSGRFFEGKSKLLEFKNDKYMDWWPLHFHLGIANIGLDLVEEAVNDFKQVLLLSPSNIDAMRELMKLYRKLGDKEMEKKYAKKIDFIMSGKGNLNEEK